MERLSIDVVENATKTVNIMPETPLDKVVADCMKDYLEMRKSEEQGLILRLQVAIGNIVYRINEYADEPIISMNVTSIEIKGITDTFKEMKCKECGFGGEFTYRFSDIGKTVFLTKEEAERALADIKGGTENDG